MNRIDLGKTPVPGENPAGIDVSYEPEFEALEAELQKMSSPTASGGVDWQKVGRLAETILETKSKNLLVAAYLNYALLKTEGLRGLSDGVHVLREMVESHWEALYPPKRRMRARSSSCSAVVRSNAGAVTVVDMSASCDFM
jgi:type VI secretion system protein VasJ